MKGINMKRFDRKVAMITGAATGIGEACAYRFAEEGADIICIDFNQEENEATARRCEEMGARTLVFTADVSDEKRAGEIMAEVTKSFGTIDILVCSAGIYTGSLIPDVTMQQWRRMLEINLTGTFIYNQAVTPVMMKQHSGSIINISSMAGKTSWPATAEYSASKSGVIGMTRSVAMELGQYGVRANAICPGNTVTAMVKRVAKEIGGLSGMSADQWLDMRAGDCALKRLAEPWEIAGIAAFLASKDAGYITGQAIEADGGIILS